MKDNTESNPTIKISIQPQRVYAFAPCDDITAMEAAWCSMAFFWALGRNEIESFEKWDLVKRHFRDVGDVDKADAAK